MKVTILCLDLEKMYNSGQQFTWSRIDNDTYSIVHKDHYLEIKSLNNHDFDLSCSEQEFKSIWYSYFDLGSTSKYLSIFFNTLEMSNCYLTKAIHYGTGIRILRQNSWETLITFIISQNNNMKRIRKSVDELRKYWSLSPLIDKNTNKKFYPFPTLFQLAQTPIEQLKEFGLGYRAEYIHNISMNLYANDNFDSLQNLSYEDLIKELKTYKGIGDKVANCIALYGYHHLQAAPIDTHMKRIINEYFNGENILNRPEFNGYQGILQQYLFDYETNKNI